MSPRMVQCGQNSNRARYQDDTGRLRESAMMQGDYQPGPRNGLLCFLHTSWRLAYSSALKSEAVDSFETSVNFHRTTWHVMTVLLVVTAVIT
jgi:hypothetical protein